jgi:cardiolipin synthase
VPKSVAWIAPIPNLLTALRLALAAAFPFLPPTFRLPAVAFAGFTDWFDGFLARRYRAQTSLGALLDGIADKAFALAVLVTLAFAHDLAVWQVGLVVLRDLAVVAICAYVAVRKEWHAFRHMEARMAGKVTTALFFAWMVALLAHAPRWITEPLFVLVSLASAAAAVDYVRKFLRALEREHAA